LHETGWVLGRLGEILLRHDYAWAVPLAVAAALALLVRRGGQELAVGVLVLGLCLVLALAFVYLNGAAGAPYLVETSAKPTRPPILSVFRIRTSSGCAATTRSHRPSRSGGPSRPGTGTPGTHRRARPSSTATRSRTSSRRSARTTRPGARGSVRTRWRRSTS